MGLHTDSVLGWAALELQPEMPSVLPVTDIFWSQRANIKHLPMIQLLNNLLSFQIWGKEFPAFVYISNF